MLAGPLNFQWSEGKVPNIGKLRWRIFYGALNDLQRGGSIIFLQVRNRILADRCGVQPVQLDREFLQQIKPTIV